MYKIVCKDLSITDIYVGHTTDFKARKNKYKSGCCNCEGKIYNLNVYQFIRENGNWDNWDMVKIEDYPCLTVLDAGKRERELTEILNATLNSNIPSRTQKEYINDNKNKIKEQQKEYRENNIEKIKDYSKDYRENNKNKILEYKKIYDLNNQEKLREKFNCDCGGHYTFHGKAIHQKTKKHLLYLDKQ
jgi:hypothetical protein